MKFNRRYKASLLANWDDFWAGLAHTPARRFHELMRKALDYKKHAWAHRGNDDICHWQNFAARERRAFLADGNREHLASARFYLCCAHPRGDGWAISLNTGRWVERRDGLVKEPFAQTAGSYRQHRAWSQAA